MSGLRRIAASAAQGLNAPTLLAPLAEASAAFARLDARLEAADPAVADGLRARLALREAAGWLAHQYAAWVHSADLGLRAAGLTSSITIAAMSGRLRATLPTTTEDAPLPEALAEDLGVVQALQLGPALAAPSRAPHLGTVGRCSGPEAAPGSTRSSRAGRGNHERMAWSVRRSPSSV